MKRKELSNLLMVAGNEKKYGTVVIDGQVKTWVGIGWITEREATEEDLKNLPVVED
jgi:formylmethanofuran dehydrogenase subunit C